MKKQWIQCVVTASLLVGGCSTSELLEETEPASLQEAPQAMTTTYTLNWPDNQQTANCRFGDTSLNHQPATNTRASGRVEEPFAITGLAGRRITALSLTSSSSTFKYDDVMLLAYNNHLVMASDRRVAEYSANTTSLGTSPVPYVWGNILNDLIDNQNIQAPWCTSGATSCTVPRTEQIGALNVNVPDFFAVDQAAYPNTPDARTFRLVTIGDNDVATDCRHGPVTLTLSVTSVPDPILGDWFSDGWGINVRTDRTARQSKTMVPACTVGTPVFENITHTGCTSSTRCTYTARRYTDTDGVTCPLRVTTVTIEVDEQRLVERENGNILRVWTRGLPPTDPLIGTWRNGQWWIINVGADGSSFLAQSVGVCAAGGLFHRNIIRSYCISATQCTYTATRNYGANATTCPLYSDTFILNVNGNVMTENFNGTIVTWTR